MAAKRIAKPTPASAALARNDTRANGESVLERADQAPEEVRKIIVAAREMLDVKAPPPYKRPPRYAPTAKLVERVGHRMCEISTLLEALHKHLYDMQEISPDSEQPLAVAMSAAREGAQACNAAAVALIGKTWDGETLNDPLSSL